MLVHARALLTSHPEGHTAYLDADLTRPEAIVGSSAFRDTFDLTKPVALSVIAVLQFIVDEAVVHDIIDVLMAPLPPGSVLALSTITVDNAPEEEARKILGEHTSRGIPPIKARALAEVRELFCGFELIDPGVVLVNHWRPDEAALAVSDEHVQMYGGVAVKR